MSRGPSDHGHGQGKRNHYAHCIPNHTLPRPTTHPQDRARRKNNGQTKGKETFSDDQTSAAVVHTEREATMCRLSDIQDGVRIITIRY